MRKKLKKDGLTDQLGGAHLGGTLTLTLNIVDMPLSDLLASYVASRDCGIRYRESLLRTLRKLALAGITSVDQFSPQLVNRFLVGLSTLSSTTRQNIRRELLTLWRFAFEEGMTEVPPLRVTKIRSRSLPPLAWSLPELDRLIECAEKDDTPIGGIHNIRICDFMPAWVSASYDTGLRFSDMLALRRTEIVNGHIAKSASKTGKALVRPLSQYALKQLVTIGKRSPDGSVFSWFLTRRRAFLAMRAFYDRHGFDGSGKYLRRSCATFIERDQPGTAWRYLQHSSPSLVPRHYQDQSLLAVPSGPPPIR
jgi:integrase